MELNNETLVGDLVSENYRLASYFTEQKIDFCCNGNRSLETVCSQKKLPLDGMLSEITTLLETKPNEPNYQLWDIGFLSDFIYQNHHSYVEQKITEIKPFLDKICKVHGSEHPELLEIKSLFEASAGELTAHMKKEELILFPYFKSLVVAEQNGTPPASRQFNSVESPIAKMHEDHNNEGERFREIEKLTNDYTPPSDACGTYRVTFSLLKEFQEDLHKHIHLENNILFKKAIALEQKLKQN